MSTTLRFVTDRLSMAAKEYAKQSTASENKTATYIANLENLLAECQRKYTVVVNQSAVSQPLSASIANSHENNRSHDVENDDVSSAQTCSRQEVIESMTWEELSRAAHTLADLKYRSQAVSSEKIQSAVLFPQFFVDDDRQDDHSAMDDGAYSQLLVAPYFTHYNSMKLALVEVGRRLEQKRNELGSRSPRQIDIATSVVPSQWMADFLYVFGRAKTAGTQHYPKPREMADVFYATKDVRLIDDRGNSVPTQLRNYTFDIGYHCVRFGSLYTTLPFNPVNDIYMKPTVYADIELLVHYAIRTAENDDVRYDNFLRSPSSFLSGSKYMYMIEAVKCAARKIMSSFDNGLYFKAHSRYGVELMKRSQAVLADTTYTKEIAAVPDNVMVGLYLDVLENRIVYERRKEMAVFGGIRKLEARDMRLESPIGKLLNFDERSIAEFEALYKEIEPRRPERVNAQLSDRVASFRCVHRVYAMLVSAAATIYAMRSSSEDSTLQVSFVLDRCMRHDPDTGAIVYASTAEAFPGLLFYTILATPVRREDFEKINSTTATDITQPGVSSPAYFANRPDRKAFFDTFGSYAFRIDSISKAKVGTGFPVDVTSANEGMRWITNEDLAIIRASTGKQLAEAQSAFITLLAFNAHSRNASTWLTDADVIAYFKDHRSTENRRGYHKLTEFHQSYTDVRAFFALPVMYSARADLIDTSKRAKIATSESASGNHRFADMLQQITAHRDNPTTSQDVGEDVADISRFIS